jgi:nucleotide-binding universal stress UspA family protein
MFEKILVPLDGSELAAKVLPTVVELAKKFNSQVTLIHACHFPGFGASSPTCFEHLLLMTGRAVSPTPPMRV